ncbi:hypothetical protein [Streptomyces sp. NPDC003717]|uniref:hypothetical protein n=1 Tax=Streptomyces sp. NPDC003717 TaxID=3154276 RepID=UPI0033B073C4
MAPAHRAGGQRVEQEPAQLAALDLGAGARAVVGLVEQDAAVRGEGPGGLPALQDEGAETVGESGGGQGRPAVVLVDVEHAALRAGRGRGVRLVDGGRDAVDVQDAGEGEPTSALMHSVFGAAGQNAANSESGRALGPRETRAGFLDAASSAWERLDPAEYAFTRAVAGQLRDHDDREQFLAGVDLVLAGITALR